MSTNELAPNFPDLTYAPERPADSFQSASLHENPLLYPGERPDDSYVTDGVSVASMRVAATKEGQVEFTVLTDHAEQPINQYLAERGAAPIEDRIPVLGYGANMCPGSLLSKYKKVERPDALVIPNAYAMLPDHDVVWSAGPGINGNFIASLYQGPETKGSAVQVGVTFMTREQLLVLHATELAYDLHRTTVALAGIEIPVYYYAGKDEVFLDDSGHPVAISGITAEGRQLGEATTSDLLAKLLADTEVMNHVRGLQPDMPKGQMSPEDYTKYIKTLRKTAENPRPRFDMKQRMYKSIAAAGRVGVAATPETDAVSWANPSTLQTFGEWQRSSHAADMVHVLPTSELEQSAWPNPEARQKVLDGLSEHFHRHYPKSER